MRPKKHAARQISGSRLGSRRVAGAAVRVGEGSFRVKASESASRLQVPALRKAFGVTQTAFGRLTGFSPRMIVALEHGARPSQTAARKLAETERLRDALLRVMPSEELPVWLDTPNQAFDGLKPLEVIERGQGDRLWRMIYELESGQPG
jgi:transcriptional regulator with XRE-family HTH domain